MKISKNTQAYIVAFLTLLFASGYASLFYHDQMPELLKIDLKPYHENNRLLTDSITQKEKRLEEVKKLHKAAECLGESTNGIDIESKEIEQAIIRLDRKIKSNNRYIDSLTIRRNKYPWIGWLVP